MKKVFSLLAGVFLCASIWAQGPHHINVYIGGFNAEYQETRTESYTSDLYSMYEPHYQINSGPTATVEYNFAVLPWLEVGAQANYAHLNTLTWRTVNGIQTDPKQSKEIFSVLPEAKFRIPSPRHFRLYGKAAAGIIINAGAYTGAPVQFAWDLVPIGCEWGGQRVYGTAELCYGNIIRGGRIGIGFRF
ncbi:MAG: hypothetical protein J6M31_08340 [Bacteroidales bacterium]|nr:hypothetical protein [Bacteroidales bacterium]